MRSCSRAKRWASAASISIVKESEPRLAAFNATRTALPLGSNSIVHSPSAWVFMQRTLAPSGARGLYVEVRSMTRARHHRADLRRVARQAMLDRGLRPDFGEAVYEQLARVTGPSVAPATRDLRNLQWCS